MGLFDGWNESPSGMMVNSSDGAGLLGNVQSWLSDPRNQAGLAAFGRAMAQAGAPRRGPSAGFVGGLSDALAGFSQGREGFDAQQMQKQMQQLQLQQAQKALQPKADPFTLSPGQVRYGADGMPVAALQEPKKRDVREVNGQLVEIPAMGSPTPLFGQPKLPEYLQYGPDGKPQINPLVVQAKGQIAAAGKPVTNVNVNTEKNLLSTLADKLGAGIDTARSQAEASVSTIGNVQRLRDALNTGKVVTGPGANVEIFARQIGDKMGMAGRDNAETLSNTRMAIQSMAQQELDAAQQMKGQGQITEAERGIIKRAAAGEITMSKGELQTLADALEKVGRAKISAYEKRVAPLLNNPNAASIAPFLTVPQPQQQSVEDLLKKYGNR